MRELIVGGGTGGICLAHGLRRAGVPVAVYERDRTRSGGPHGDRAGINPTGDRADRCALRRGSQQHHLLGGAIHTMNPLPGVGANTALCGAALLCRQLTAAAQGGSNSSRPFPPTGAAERTSKWFSYTENPASVPGKYGDGKLAGNRRARTFTKQQRGETQVRESFSAVANVRWERAGRGLGGAAAYVREAYVP